MPVSCLLSDQVPTINMCKYELTLELYISLANALRPGSVKKIDESKMVFKMVNLKLLLVCLFPLLYTHCIINLFYDIMYRWKTLEIFSQPVISQFLQSMGVAKTDLFQTVDLYEQQNIPQVNVIFVEFYKHSNKI